jgi:RNA polymerase sigma-70 factor (ECF subfamily)
MIDLDSAIAATLKGDVEAFGTVIEASQAYVRSFIACFVADENDVSDIAQETFVFAFEHLDEYEIGTNFLAWLKAIARNKVMSFQRRGRQNRESRRQYVADRAIQRAVILTPDYSEERVHALSRCIEELPDEQRTFLTSVLNRDTTLEKWADKADMATDTVRKRISRLYTALRDCIRRRLATGGQP